MSICSRDSVFPTMDYVLTRVLKEEMGIYGYNREVETKKDNIVVASKVGWDYTDTHNASGGGIKTRKNRKNKKIDILGC